MSSVITEAQRKYREEYLRSAHWQNVRRGALERAAYHCQVCNGARSLDVHHRTYERLGNERPEDVTVLCRDCHGLFHRRNTVPSQTVSPKVAPPREQSPSAPDLTAAIMGILALGPATTEEVALITGGSAALVGTRLAQLRSRKRVWRKGRGPWVLGPQRESYVERAPRKANRGKKKKVSKLEADNERLHLIQQRNKLKQQAVANGSASPALRAELVERYRR